MDGSKTLKNISTIISKYKYAIIILLVGIGLMLLPKRSDGNEATQSVTVAPQETTSIEIQLAHILSQVKGAGRVEVMLTVKEGEQTLYQTDTHATQSDASASNTNDTVIITDKNRGQSALVQQVYGPKYLGAIVLCSGANDPQVRLAIVDAVSKITGLGADRISVLELK